MYHWLREWAGPLRPPPPGPQRAAFPPALQPVWVAPLAAALGRDGHALWEAGATSACLWCGKWGPRGGPWVARRCGPWAPCLPARVVGMVAGPSAAEAAGPSLSRDRTRAAALARGLFRDQG